MGVDQEIRQTKRSLRKTLDTYDVRDERVENIVSILKHIRKADDEAERDQERWQRELRNEEEKDLKDRGVHTDNWEIRIADRLEIIPDLREELRERQDRVAEVLLDRREDRQQAVKRIDNLEERLERLQRRRTRQAQSDGQLTRHWHIAEFACHDAAGTPVPDHSVDTLTEHCQHLERLNARFGTGHCNSGHRTRAYNASIGGASLSIHIYDGSYQHPPFAVATDIWFVGTPHYVVANAIDADPWFTGIGRYTSFTHGDCRHRIGWTPAEWNGP